MDQKALTVIVFSRGYSSWGKMYSLGIKADVFHYYNHGYEFICLFAHVAEQLRILPRYKKWRKVKELSILDYKIHH